MFYVGMLVGGAVVALLVFVAMVARVVRFGMSVRCDTCGTFAPPQPLVTERHAGGVRMKRPTTPQGWRDLPGGQHECAACVNNAFVESLGRITHVGSARVEVPRG